MQKIYIFHDTDPAGKEEYDISGNAFHTLLAACCRYCTILTLRFPQQVPAAEALEPYRIPNDERLPLDIVYAHYGTLSFGEVRSYRVCPELIALFSSSLTVCSNGFGAVDMPIQRIRFFTVPTAVCFSVRASMRGSACFCRVTMKMWVRS